MEDSSARVRWSRRTVGLWSDGVMECRDAGAPGRWAECQVSWLDASYRSNRPHGTNMGLPVLFLVRALWISPASHPLCKCRDLSPVKRHAWCAAPFRAPGWHHCSHDAPIPRHHPLCISHLPFFILHPTRLHYSTVPPRRHALHPPAPTPPRRCRSVLPHHAMDTRVPGQGGFGGRTARAGRPL